MTPTDLLLLAVIGVSALLGWMRGLIGVLASLLAWLLAGWAAFRFGALAARAIAGGADPGPGQLLAVYGLSFLGVLVVVGLVCWGMRQLVKSVGLSGLDRTLGLGIGLARGGLVACMLVLLMGFSSMPREPGWQDSEVLPVLLPGARWLSGWLPEWAAQRIDFGTGAASSPPNSASMRHPPSMQAGDAPPSPRPRG